jgi:hypothetical protein
MAFPAREKTFKLDNCRDLYNKLAREINRFKHDQADQLALADHAFKLSLLRGTCAIGWPPI